MHRTIQAEAVEEFVGEQVYEREEEAQMAAVGDPAGVQGPILAQLDEIDERLNAFAENVALAGMPVSAIRSGTKALLAERERLEAELAAVAMPPALTTDLTEAMLAHDIEFRALLEALVDRIVVHPATRPVNVFNPARVEIVWR